MGSHSKDFQKKVRRNIWNQKNLQGQEGMTEDCKGKGDNSVYFHRQLFIRTATTSEAQ